MGVMLHLLHFLAVHHALMKNNQKHKSFMVKGFHEIIVLLYGRFVLTTH